MKICKVFMLLCALVCIPKYGEAQNRQFKNERRIFLWDVTLSMKGYEGKTPDIYDEVVKALGECIDKIDNAHTEIWVVPFQNRVLDCWQIEATAIEKKQLKFKIDNALYKDTTYTNIVSPIKYAMHNLMTPDKRNILMLMTDGIHNDPKCDVSQLYDLMRNWCEYAEKNDAHAFYVMLTKFAHDEQLIEAIESACRMETVVIDDNGGGIDINFYELTPQRNYKYNIKDDEGKGVSLQVACNQPKLPEGLKIRCYCAPNPYIEVNEAVTIENGLLSVSLQHRQDYNSLKTALPQDVNEEIMLYFSVEDPVKFNRVMLMEKECRLELINKPEKTLKVYVKE